jgi:hypothetical protein
VLYQTLRFVGHLFLDGNVELMSLKKANLMADKVKWNKGKEI